MTRQPGTVPVSFDLHNFLLFWLALFPYLSAPLPESCSAGVSSVLQWANSAIRWSGPLTVFGDKQAL